MNIRQVEKEINDDIEDEHDNEVNVADDKEIKHKASLTPSSENSCRMSETVRKLGNSLRFTASISFYLAPFNLYPINQKRNISSSSRR